MAAILVVCTGNVCRSPIAEGLLRDALEARFGAGAPSVTSAGTAGWEGWAPVPESVRAGAERGVDIASHRARRLRSADVQRADLVVVMGPEHREAVERLLPGAGGRAFTLKELVRLLEALPEAPPLPLDAGERLALKVAQANELRRSGFGRNSLDDDVADPLGTPYETFRAIAWELDEWCSRLAEGLFGRAPSRAGTGGT